MASRADDVLVINHHQANLAFKERTAKGGAVTSRSVITISVNSEPIGFMLDEGAVAKRAAEMYAQRIREQTAQIAATVSASTAAARRKMERAFGAGRAYAVRRYSGGRTGLTPPRSGEDRAFFHSGRLAESIVARYVDKSKEFVINFAANRWNVADWPNAARMQIAFQRWVELVPVLKAPAADLGIQRAIRETFGDVVEKAEMNAGYRATKLRLEGAVKVFQQAVEVIAA